MRIMKNDKLVDVPIVKIRDYFKQFRNVGISKLFLRNHFDLSEKKVNLLIKELINNDFIEENIPKKWEYENEYRLTDKGQALCAARSVSPMNKEKADKIFLEFMNRVEEVNNNDYYLCKVEKLLLFGSYLDPNKNDYGDIDIAHQLKRKIEDFDEYEKARKRRILEMENKGKYFSSFMEESFFPEHEVRLKLKNKCQYISLHEIDDWVLNSTKYKQIYLV